jgi:hypothetical protein
MEAGLLLWKEIPLPPALPSPSSMAARALPIYPDLAPPDEAQVQGALSSTSGKTFLSPLADSIDDFFDTETGTLRGRLLTPDLLLVGNLQVGNFHPAAIALDPNQQTIYAISASGLSVMTLPTSSTR